MASPRTRTAAPASENASAAPPRRWREDVPDDRLAHILKDTMRGLARALHARIAAHEVSIGHWAFLRILWDGDGLTQRELSEQSGLSDPTTFTAMQAMERLGLVERSRDPGDRRRVCVFLTPKGRALKDRLAPLAEEVSAIALQGVSPGAVAATQDTLLAMTENLTRDKVAATGEPRRIPATRSLSRPPRDPGRNSAQT